MLGSGRSLFACHLQAAKDSLNHLCRKPLATLMTMVVISIALALPTLFWVFTDNLGRLTHDWQKNGHISLYLKPALSLVDQTKGLKQVQSILGVGQAILISPDEGLKEVTQQEGMGDITRYLPENPLPAVIDVLPALSVNTPAKMDQLYQQLKANPLVDQAKLDMQWINRLHAILALAETVAESLMLLLALAVFLVVGNTLRLAIHHRHEEIQVLKLIGAADPFILRPFLYSGIWYGLAGSVIAILLVNIFMLSLSLASKALESAYNMRFPFYGMSIRQILLLIIFATILGWLGARFSVKRQLASIEPYN